MSPDTLDPRQQLVLWSLAARGGSALLSDLRPRLDPKRRRALEALKLVASAQEGRAVRVELADAGWRALGEVEPKLVEARETRVPSERHLLQALLSQLARFMRDEKVAPAQVFRPLETKSVAAARPRRRTSKTPAGAAIEDAVRAAYRDLAGEAAREAVRLSALRARLPDIPRADLDAALLAMRKAGRANLMNLDNPRDIAPEKDAALTAGIHTFHVVWIDP